MYKVIVFIAVLFCIPTTYGQTIDEDLIHKELQGRNIDEEELMKRLEAKGVHTDQLSELTPEELVDLKGVVEETVKEMEEEKDKTPVLSETEVPPPVKKSQSNVDKTPPTQTDPIKKTISKKVIPVYGKSIFTGSLPLFERTDDANVPDQYVLGSGDQISVSIWGISQLNRNYEINSAGYIHPQKMPRLYLKGLTLLQAKQLLRDKFRQFYPFNKQEFEVSLNHIRTITVHIYGEVNHPGGYNIPATNTALNALVAAGGPDSLGSIRKITLNRGQQKITVDIYKWLDHPEYAYQLYLNDNDVIYVPVANHIVEIKGAVYRPMQYEMVKGEQLSDLLGYAGGLKPNAYRENINITRYEKGKKIIKSIPWTQLQKEHRDFQLMPGDQIEVKTLNELDKELVSIQGAVEYPGNYAWTPQTHIADILDKAKLLKRAKLDIAYVTRFHPDSSSEMIKVRLSPALSDPDDKNNILLLPNDLISILDMKKLMKEQYIEIIGSVYRPGKLPYDKSQSMRVSDAIFLADGLKDDAFSIAYIERKDPNDINHTQYIRINIQQIMQQPGGKDDLILYPNDRIIIESNDRFKEDQFYKISGEVKNPGSFKYRSGMTVEDAILQSGGLSPLADKRKIEIFRVSQNTRNQKLTLMVDDNYRPIGSKNIELMPEDHIVVRRLPNYAQQRLVFIKGEVKYPGEYALSNPNLKLSDIIAEAGGLTQEAFPEGASLYRQKDSLGFVVIKLKEALSKPSSRNNIYLAEQDVINIPKKKDLVTIEGATNASEVYFGGNIDKGSRISVPYLPGKNAKFYIDEYAAGISKRGNKNDITVIDPNGKVSHTVNYLFFKKYPKVRKGSVIRVGYKVTKTKKSNGKEKKFDWEKVADNTLRQVTTILSLVILAKSASSL